ncbi:hypothetical protein CBS101457_004641 [Exobasidium rhododendri]|nr:hypothetical protein CBS101457_004641 [Exobasidium rhododendri]
MEIQPGSEHKAIGELLTQLLSHDPVEYNSAINSKFASSVVYSGHGLKIEGASNFKHASWLLNSVASGIPATFELKDISWSEENKAAIVRSVQYARLRFFPLVGFAVPVQSLIKFHADGGSSSKKESTSQLYVTSYEDHTPLDSFVKKLPLIGALYQALFIPIATFFVLAISNAVFAGYTTANASKRRYVDTSVEALSERAQKSIPKDLTKNVQSGFKEGRDLAEGWGTKVVNTVQRVSYPVLSTIEHISQQSVSVSNQYLSLPLPYPYIYDAHSHPSGSAAKPFSAGKAKKPSTNTAPAKDSSAPQQDQEDEGAKRAAVQVAPALDGSDQGKKVDIAHRIDNEGEEKAAPAVKQGNGHSLYDQLRKDGELPGQKDSAALSVPAHDQGEGSSEEEGHSGTHPQGSSIKKKSASKKKKAVHPHQPTFKEALHQVEEQEAAQAQEHHEHH